MPPRELVFRLCIATVLGAILGLNRNLRGKAAGLRTHGLVSLGAALTVLTADLIIGTAPGVDRGGITRAMQGVMAGVGFLGAGAILKTSTGRHDIRGLTTAASIWLAACVGMASGAGAWLPAFIGVVLALVVLSLGRPIEDAVDGIFGVTPRHHAIPGGDAVPESTAALEEP